MARTRHIALASLALAATALMAGCGGPKTDHLTVSDGPAGGGNGITPAKLAVHKGHKVELQVTNTAKDKQHGFSIDAYNVHYVLEPGTTTTVKFKANQSGTFVVYCQLHATHGKSELDVT